MSRVQSSGNKISDASSTLVSSFIFTPVVGNLVTFIGSCWRDIGATVSVADNQGNSWSRTVAGPIVGHGTSDVTSEIWSALVTTSSGTFTITVTQTGAAGNSYMSGCFDEYDNVSSSPTILTNTGSGGFDAGVVNSGSVNPTTTSLVLAVAASDTVTSNVITANGPPFIGDYNEGNGSLHAVGHGDYIIGYTGSTSCTTIFGNADAFYTACIATFSAPIVSTRLLPSLGVGQ